MKKILKRAIKLNQRNKRPEAATPPTKHQTVPEIHSNLKEPRNDSTLLQEYPHNQKEKTSITDSHFSREIRDAITTEIYSATTKEEKHTCKRRRHDDNIIQTNSVSHHNPVEQHTRISCETGLMSTNKITSKNLEKAHTHAPAN